MSYVEYGFEAEDQDVVVLRELKSAMHFSDRDLSCNRQGEMSSLQMLKVLAKAILPVLGLLIPFMGLIAMGAFAATLFPFLAGKARLLMMMGDYLLGFLAALLFGLIALIINFFCYSGRLLLYLWDLSQGKVRSDVGRLYVSKSEEVEDGVGYVLRTKTETYSCTIRSESYQISPEAHEALMEYAGSLFRVYYTPKSRFLLALEPARGDSGQ